MIAQSAKVRIVCSILAALTPAVAHAQLDDRTVVSILRECRKLEETAARTACYDNIPLGQPPAGRTGAAADPQRPQGFGGDQLRRAATARTAEPSEIRAKVSGIAEREPGIYVLTLEDGAQWQFVDAPSTSYDPPRPGSTIEISKASLGSYLMRYADQRGIRIRRIR